MDTDIVWTHFVKERILRVCVNEMSYLRSCFAQNPEKNIRT